MNELYKVNEPELVPDYIKQTLLYSIATGETDASLIKSFFSKQEVPIRVKTLEEYKKNIDKYVLDFIGMVQQYKGYTAEDYNVTTSDGYILTLHRITNSPLNPKKHVKPVIYMQHGLVGSSDAFVIGGPENSLAFQLADAGFDVWLGNSRGNFYSRSHVVYSPDKDLAKFWDFGIDELGTHDLIASIDYILAKTNQKNLTYIGYSLGTTLGYVLLSSKPEYNKKINLLVSIAPIAYFTDPPYDLLLRTSYFTVLNVAKWTNAYEIMPLSTTYVKVSRKLCKDSKTILCKSFFKVLSDFDHADYSRLKTLLLHTPAGTSYRTTDHVWQIFSSGKFHKYDYGCNFLWCNNQKFYNQRQPPEYNLSLITAPNVIVSAKDDVFVKPEDVNFLTKKLNNVVESIKITTDNFNHLDFILSSQVNTLVHNKILKSIISFQSNQTSF